LRLQKRGLGSGIRIQKIAVPISTSLVERRPLNAGCGLFFQGGEVFEGLAFSDEFEFIGGNEDFGSPAAGKFANGG